MADIPAGNVVLGANDKPLADGLKKADTKVKGFFAGLKSSVSGGKNALAGGMEKLTSGLKGKLGGLGEMLGGKLALGLGIGFAAVASVQALKGAIDEVRDLRDASRSLGVSAEDLSTWSFAANKVEVSTQDLQGGLKNITSIMSQANSGDLGAKRLFEGLGLSLRDLEGGLGAVLPKLVDGFSRLKDPAAQSRAALELFGESGLKMLPLLREGPEGLAKMRAETEQFGKLRTDADLAAFQEYDKKVAEVTLAAQGFAQELFLGLSDGFQGLMSALGLSSGDWVKDFTAGVKYVRSFVVDVFKLIAHIPDLLLGAAGTAGGFFIKYLVGGVVKVAQIFMQAISFLPSQLFKALGITSASDRIDAGNDWLGGVASNLFAAGDYYMDNSFVLAWNNDIDESFPKFDELGKKIETVGEKAKAIGKAGATGFAALNGELRRMGANLENELSTPLIKFRDRMALISRLTRQLSAQEFSRDTAALLQLKAAQELIGTSQTATASALLRDSREALEFVINAKTGLNTGNIQDKLQGAIDRQTKVQEQQLNQARQLYKLVESRKIDTF